MNKIILLGIFSFFLKGSFLAQTQLGGQGIRVNNFTQAERNVLISPTVGQMIYQTDNTPGYYHWDGDSWESVAPSGGSYLPLTGGTLTGSLTGTTGNFTTLNANQVGIGTNSPSVNAAIEISSTSKGMLPPRMTTEQRDAIVNPVPGLLIFNTTVSKLQGYAVDTWVDLH